MATLVSSAQITITDQSDIATGYLSNDFIAVSTDSSGNPLSYSGTNTELRIYQGSVPLNYDAVGTSAGKWKVDITASGITPGSAVITADDSAHVFSQTVFDAGGSLYQGQTMNFAAIGVASSMSSDTASITFKVSGKDLSGIPFQLTKVQTFNKNKAAALSPSYWLTSSAGAIKKSEFGILSPASVTFTGYTTSGSGTPVTYAGRFTCAYTTDGTNYTVGYTSSANEIFTSYTPPANSVAVRCIMYMAGGIVTALDQETIPVVLDGSTAVTAVLSNESHTVPTDSAGLNGNFTGCATTMSVYVGATDDSANWTYSATKTNVTATEAITSRTQTVTALSAGVGYIDITASKSGYSSVTKRFTVTKSKDGVTGSLFGIANSSVIFKRDLANTVTPASVTLSVNAPGVSGMTYTWKRGATTVGSAATYDILAADFALITTTSLQYSVTVTGTINGLAGQVLTDTITVPCLAEVGAPVAVLSNEAITLQGPATGYNGVTYNGANCDVTAYIGTKQLSYNTSGAWTFSCTNSSSGITVASGTGSGSTFSVPVPTGTMTLDNAYTDVVITLRDGAGATVATLTKRISYALSRSGTNPTSQCVVYAYQRATVAPTYPGQMPGDVTVTIASGTITTPATDALLNGWTKTIPAGTNPLYITVATAASTSTTDSILNSEWSTPQLLAASGANGGTGAAGLNVATAVLYTRTASSTAPLGGALVTGGTFTFNTGAITGFTSSATWTQTVPVGGGAYLWATRATASASAPSASLSGWSAPEPIAQDGTDATTYYLTADTTTITNNSGTFFPGTVTFSSYSKKGSASGVLTPLWYKIYLNGTEDASQRSASATTTKVVSPQYNTNTIKVEIYPSLAELTSGTPTTSGTPVLDSQTVPVTTNLTQAVLDATNTGGGKTYTQDTDPVPSPKVTFSRASVGYKSDGSSLAANIPRCENGKFGQAIIIEHQVTNLFTQLSSDAFGVSSGGGGWSFPATYNYRYDYTQTYLSMYRGFDNTVASGSYYTISFEAYMSSDCNNANTGTTPIFALESAIGATLLYDNSKKGTWQKISYTGIASGTTVRALMYPCWSGRPSTTGYIQYRNVQFESGATKTTFTNGSRAAEYADIPAASPVLNLREGTIELWFKPTPAFFATVGVSTSWQKICGQSTAMNVNELTIARNSQSNGIAFYLSDNAGTPNTGWASCVSTTSLVADVWYHIAVTWSVTAQKQILYINGVAESTLSTITNYPTVYGAFSIGYHPQGVRWCCSWIDDLRVSSIARPAAEIYNSYIKGSPALKDQSTTLLLPFDTWDVWNRTGTTYPGTYNFNGVDWAWSSSLGAPSGTNVGSTPSQTIETNAMDPAARINAASTKILPGKLYVNAGGTATLDSWTSPSDTTAIEGGKIYANSITANKLTLGNRGLSIVGIEFTAQHASASTQALTTNVVYWTGGYIQYTNVSGTVILATISAGSWTYSGQLGYITWSEGATVLVGSTSLPLDSQVTLATYYGGTDLVVTYGRTIVDGSKIITGTITADRITSNSITTSQIQAGGINADRLVAGSITADRIAAGAITTDKLAIGSTVFYNEIFDYTSTTDITDRWSTIGAGELALSAPTNLAITGNRYISLGNNAGNDEITIYLKNKMLFDPDKLYKFSVRCSKQAGTTVFMYAGFMAYKYDGTVLDVSGNTTTLAGNQHAHCMSAILPSAGFTTYTGYTKGFGTTTGSNGNTTITTPGKMHPLTRYIVPFICTNYSGTTGQIDVDSIVVETCDTVIDGGNIYTGTISANKLTLSSQDVTLYGVDFKADVATNTVSWIVSSGATIIYDNGSSSQGLSATTSSSVWSSNPIFIYWDKYSAPTSLQVSLSNPTSTSSKLLAVYRGVANLDVLYGSTIINGNKIDTGTITAANIKSGTITATELAADSITTVKLAAGAITASKIAAGEITTDLLSFGSRAKIADTFSKAPDVSGYTDMYTTGTLTFLQQNNDGVIGNDSVLITFT